MTIADTRAVDGISRNLINVETPLPATLVMSGDWETQRGLRASFSFACRHQELTSALLNLPWTGVPMTDLANLTDEELEAELANLWMVITEYTRRYGELTRERDRRERRGKLNRTSMSLNRRAADRS